MTLELTQEQKDAGWQVKKLSECFDIIGGGTPKTSIGEYWGGEIPWLSVTDFSGSGRTVNEAEKSITQLGLDNSSAKVLERGDLIISARGTVGELAQLGRAMAFNQSCYGLRGASGVLTNNYGFYLMKTIVSALRQQSHGSVFSTITRGTFESIEVVIPPVIEQKRVAEILGSIDDKIEANSRLLGSLYKLLHELYLFQVSQSGQKIPLNDIADFFNGKAFTKNATGTGRMVVRIAELNSGPGASTVYNEIPDVDEKHLVNPGEILMSWSGTLGVFLWPREQAIINQHIFKVVPKPGYPLSIVYCAIQSVIEKFQAIAQDKATTMGHIKRGDLETPVLVPSNTEELEEVFSLISTVEQENITLAESRDHLIRYIFGGSCA